MKSELLKKLRDEYNSYQIEREQLKEKLNALISKKEKYEEYPIIKEYFELIDVLEKCEERMDFLTNEHWVNNSLMNTFNESISINQQDANNIYVFMGYGYNDEGSMCSFYKNIESETIVSVNMIKEEDFEENNVVVKLKPQYPEQDDLNDKYLFSSFEDLFDMVRYDYVIDSVMDGEEKAVQKVLSKEI